MPILAPFEAFARDAAALNVEEDESRLPIRWLAAAQVATRIADSRPQERRSLLRVWVRQQAEDGADGVWSALRVPGIPVHDLGSASDALCTIAADMERGGAFNLAYSTVTHMRIAMMARGPVRSRANATLQQARVLRQMGLLEEASDTYEAAMEDAVRAGDSDLEVRALLGMSVVAGQRGNYPDVLRLGQRALGTMPPNSEHAAGAHNGLMIAAMATGNYPLAFEHGWRGYDAAGSDPERRATMISNLAFLALRRARFTAARRGLLAALGQSKLERIQLPALGGLALVCAATRDVPELKRVAAKIDTSYASAAFPYELARARVELAEAWKETGDLEKAEESLAVARKLADAHGFHEVTFRSEILAEALAATRNKEASVINDLVESSIARFDELSITEGELVIA